MFNYAIAHYDLRRAKTYPTHPNAFSILFRNTLRKYLSAEEHDTFSFQRYLVSYAVVVAVVMIQLNMLLSLQRLG